MTSLGAKYLRFHAIEELHKAQAAVSTDLRALHVRWANFYSERLAQLNASDGEIDDARTTD